MNKIEKYLNLVIETNFPYDNVIHSKNIAKCAYNKFKNNITKNNIKNSILCLTFFFFNIIFPSLILITSFFNYTINL